MQMRDAVLLWALLLMTVITICIWAALFSLRHDRELEVVFLDVGQGDAIFITAPDGTQTLIDGGAGTAVLRQVARHMSWFDRDIDLVIATHADADHIGGLVDLLPRYRVHAIGIPKTPGDTPLWRTFIEHARQEAETGAVIREMARGDRIALGGEAYLDVLFPDRSLPGVETNTGCVVTRLVYGETAFMLSCDAPDEIERYLVSLGDTLQSDVLKAGHHGSKTSSDPLFIDAVHPKEVVYSRGCDNRYGHPSPEVVARFEERGVSARDTCRDGAISYRSDGKSVVRQ